MVDNIKKNQVKKFRKGLVYKKEFGIESSQGIAETV
jgi:hypothetical protein